MSETIVIDGPPPPNAPTCRYYVRRIDAAVFAIRCEGQRPARAVGPLSPQDRHTKKPMEHFAGDAGEDARGWDLSAFAPVGSVFALVAAPPPITRKKVIETDGKTGFRVGFFG